MKMDCLLSGVGGQGTVLASKLIAQAAMNRGSFVRTAETIGMAQRGGCVISHVRVGDEIHSPMIPKGGADVIIGFEPGEAARAFPFLKEDGVVIACTKAIRPVTASLSKDGYTGDTAIAYLNQNVKNLVLIDGDKICAELGSAKVLNVALLGAASQYLGFSMQEMEQAIAQRVPERFVELNLKALHMGRDRP